MSVTGPTPGRDTPESLPPSLHQSRDPYGKEAPREESLRQARRSQARRSQARYQEHSQEGEQGQEENRSRPIRSRDTQYCASRRGEDLGGPEVHHSTDGGG